MAKEWTEEEIRQQVQNSSAKPVVELPKTAKTTDTVDTLKRRNLMVIGCGDGGSMIASEIRQRIPETYCICYNTSTRAMDAVVADRKVIPEAEDGSGKVRDYSKEVFKQGSYKYLLGNVQSALNGREDISYIIITTTTDGGTGSGVSPMVAKFISDNVEIPVIIVGVLPALSEDATAQFNAMNWQSEVEKIGIPYMLFDNNIEGTPKPMIHKMVNSEVVNALKVITGDYYGNSNISMIDSRDMYMLLQHTGKRIVIVTNTVRPVTGETLDNYVTNMIGSCHEPMPTNVKGIGVFLKGPSSMVNAMDTSLPAVRQKYGNAAIQYFHIEESSDIQISVIMSGCSEASDRLYLIRSRYDDIMNAQRADQSELGALLDGMNNPLGGVKKKLKDNAEPDLSALDI